jgi:hypothetical protein
MVDPDGNFHKVEKHASAGATRSLARALQRFYGDFKQQQTRCIGKGLGQQQGVEREVLQQEFAVLAGL